MKTGNPPPPMSIYSSNLPVLFRTVYVVGKNCYCCRYCSIPERKVLFISKLEIGLIKGNKDVTLSGPTVKPLVIHGKNGKCRLSNFSMGFIPFYVNLSICENK